MSRGWGGEYELSIEIKGHKSVKINGAEYTLISARFWAVGIVLALPRPLPRVAVLTQSTWTGKVYETICLGRG